MNAKGLLNEKVFFTSCLLSLPRPKSPGVAVAGSARALPRAEGLAHPCSALCRAGWELALTPDTWASLGLVRMRWGKFWAMRFGKQGN